MRRPLYPQRAGAAKTGRRAAWHKRRHRSFPTRLEITSAMLRVIAKQCVETWAKQTADAFDRHMLKYLNA